jgi:hypothetical protein
MQKAQCKRSKSNQHVSVNKEDVYAGDLENGICDDLETFKSNPA